MRTEWDLQSQAVTWFGSSLAAVLLPPRLECGLWQLRGPLGDNSWRWRMQHSWGHAGRLAPRQVLCEPLEEGLQVLHGAAKIWLDCQRPLHPAHATLWAEFDIIQDVLQCSDESELLMLLPLQR